MLGRLLFLAHIGLGLLWQPFVHPRRRLGFGGVALVICAAGFLAANLNWGLLALWLMLLTGVVGGKVFLFPNRWERFFYLLGLGYLTLVLLIHVLPEAARLPHADHLLDKAVLYLAPILFVLMGSLPAGQGSAGERAEIVDYIYGAIVFLLLAAIVLGSISVTLMYKTDYFEALMVTLALVAGILLLLGFIWNPRAGFGGLGSAVAQHVMSVGMPFEDWLASLTNLSQQEEEPDTFLARACDELPQRLPGVIGGRWATPSNQGAFGESSPQTIQLCHESLQVTLACRVSPSPTLRWQYGMAVRVLAEFYAGKWRAQELKRMSFVEAVHETGARLTHDVKNLLQTLDTLCAAMKQPGGDMARFGELLKRQLPEISLRLRQTLLKLEAPRGAEAPDRQPALTWFEALQRRYAGMPITFSRRGVGQDGLVPDAGLFSSVTENLLQNIADKQRIQADLQAEVSLFDDGSGIGLDVSDSGLPIPADIARRLLAERVPSDSGLGIGLYQCARLAEQRGYRLELAENRPGAVRFRLRPA